ncbi:MAG: hypothetical protein ACLU8W_09945 [Clostridia bacterium]
MFKIDLLRYPDDSDWLRCKELALNTVGKHAVNMPSEEWKKKILDAGHSPIRTLMFTVRMEIPYYISVHFVRHKVGVEHYVQSQRNDRQSDYDRTKAPQDSLVTHIMDLNAAALIEMSHRRLCGQADPMTHLAMFQICSEVIKTNPEFTEVLIPMCEYRGECHEMNSCGAFKRLGEVLGNVEEQ